MKTTMSLMEANTEDEVCQLPRDNFDAGDFWLLCDGGTVTLAAQKPGESPTGNVKITKKEFNRLIRAYMRQQRIKRKAT